ncbi:MAG: hypothetical protein AAF479_07015 [Pseudomonadota bacterium]
MTETSQIKPSLTEQERDRLLEIVAMIIPSSAEFSVPGADDPAIFTEIVEVAEANSSETRAAIAAVDALGDLTAAAMGAALQRTAPEAATHLQAITTQCYYRDPRVLEAIGVEPRPPFPKGYQVEQGDFSLLDPVRSRGPIWRAVD